MYRPTVLSPMLMEIAWTAWTAALGDRIDGKAHHGRVLQRDYVRAGYAFDTTRKAAWIAASLSSQPIAHIGVRRPEPVTAEQLGEVHQPAYVDAVRAGRPRELAESQGFIWDPRLLSAVCASTGGVLAAARIARNA